MVDLPNLVASAIESDRSGFSAAVILSNNSRTVRKIREVVPSKLRMVTLTSSAKVSESLKEDNFEVELLEDSFVNVTIYDILGNVVDELYDGFQTSGNKSIKWDARNTSGELVSAGMYFYKIQVGNSSQVKRMMFLK